MKKEIIQKLRKITDSSLSICFDAYEKFGNDLEKCLDYVKGKMLEKGSKINLNIDYKKSFCIKDTGNCLIILKMQSNTDFVLKKKEYQELAYELVENIDNIYFDETIQSYTYSDEYTDKLKILRNKYGENINFSFYLKLQQYNYYCHNEIAKNIYEGIAVINKNLLNGKDLCLNIYGHATECIEELGKLRNIKDPKKTIVESFGNLEDIKIYLL